MESPIRILSLDGGGVRGIVPLLILNEIERITGRRIHESFDLISGTSTGAIIACGLTVSENGTTPLYTINEIIDLYKNESKTIFPKQNFLSEWVSYFRPSFSSKGIDIVLRKYFKSLKISNCLAPIIIASFDLRDNKPLLFKSRLANNGSHGYSHRKDIELYDALRATSAAPTYLPSYKFDYTDIDGTNPKKVNCIDGGVYVNNPALAALTEIRQYYDDPIYNYEEFNDDNLFILSLGTGMYNKDFTKSPTEKWGKLQWARPVIDLMMQASSKLVDNQANGLLKYTESENYLRANINIKDEKFSDMSNSDSSVIEYLEEEVNSQLLNSNSFSIELNQFIINAGL